MNRLEGTSIPYLTDFRKHLLDRYPLSPGNDPIAEDVPLPPKWILQMNEGTPDLPVSKHESPATVDGLDYDVRPLAGTFTAIMTQNKRVTPASHWQDVRHIHLVTTESMPYQCGDMISITPKNFPDDVQSLIDLMGWNKQADQRVSLVPGTISTAHTALSPPIPKTDEYPGLTLRALLTDYLDIKSIPRRSFFSTILHYTDDAMQKERLLEFTNPEYVDEFWDYTTRPRRSILEVLQEFHTVRIPWQHIPSVFPVMRDRQFSIASGGALRRADSGSSGTKFELLVAIVKYQTVIKKIREGVCTRYLSFLRPGSTLNVQLQRGSLGPSSPQQLAGPCILVGPGTGVAPLRSLLWQKAALATAYEKQQQQQQQQQPQDPIIGPSMLLFGGRSEKADFFFQDEWPVLATITRLEIITAFSRDQRAKIYVQDRIRERYSLFYHILYRLGGSVYVCGSSGRMPLAVREALIECFQHGAAGDGVEGFTRKEAEAYLVEMERIGRYKQETW